ncbi:MAG: type II secretion system F family protein [Deltaproteobacteria bacterium]|nr:type II secretion system F family protein [Deltaproteobacteria bacterium]
MQFVCRLGTPEGQIIEERHQGRDERSLQSELERRGYHVFAIQRSGLLGKLSLPSFGRGLKKVPTEKFLIFNQELAALLRAGLPLLQALDMMLERMSDPHMGPVMRDIRDRVKSGENLSDAFASYGDVFPRLYASSLKAGERSGEMENVIRRFTRYLQLVSSARRKIVSALAYPSVLILLSLAMLLIMALFVIPKFTSFYQDMNAELPLITKITLGVASGLRENALLILISSAVGFFFFQQWRKTPSGAITFDRLRLKIPVVGPILHRFGLAEFGRALATLLSGGIPLVSAMEIAVAGIGNAFLRDRMHPTVEKVRQGQSFHSALEETNSVTDMAIDMIKVGEATGALDEMLNSVADFLDEQVETQTQRLLSLVEPVLLVFMGGIIGLLLISIYLPMFSVITQVQ